MKAIFPPLSWRYLGLGLCLFLSLIVGEGGLIAIGQTLNRHCESNPDCSIFGSNCSRSCCETIHSSSSSKTTCCSETALPERIDSTCDLDSGIGVKCACSFVPPLSPLTGDFVHSIGFDAKGFGGSDVEMPMVHDQARLVVFYAVLPPLKTEYRVCITPPPTRLSYQTIFLLM